MLKLKKEAIVEENYHSWDTAEYAKDPNPNLEIVEGRKDPVFGFQEMRILVISYQQHHVKVNMHKGINVSKERDMALIFFYLHFGAIRIGLAPLFRHGLNIPCIAELFDTRHNIYDHARIGTIMGNLSSACQHGTIYPDYAISLTDIHL